jgi:thiol-disulfide isomerase/thioredoxin
VVGGFFCLLVSSGCLQEPAETGGPSAISVDASNTEAGPRYRYPDEPPVLDAQGLRAFVGRFRHRVVLLDFWASWCPRNREDMGVLIDLQEEMGHDSFQVIACNLDDPSLWSTGTVPLLNGLRASYPCVVLHSDAKTSLRTWLDPDWGGDLPARFILDAQGRVAAHMLSSGSVREVEQEVRRLAQASGVGNGTAALAPDAYALRIKLIDVRKGRAFSIPEVSMPGGKGSPLADQVYEHLAAEIDRRLNARIAILPFHSVRGRSDAEVVGRSTAGELEDIFRKHGYFDLVGPPAAERMIGALGLTAMGIEFDPSAAQGKVSCDFLVLGWVRGPAEPGGRESSLVSETREPVATNKPPEQTATGRVDP